MNVIIVHRFKSVLAVERTQILSDPIPGLSVDTLGGYRVRKPPTPNRTQPGRVEMEATLDPGEAFKGRSGSRVTRRNGRSLN
jgi:hypothetical protein